MKKQQKRFRVALDVRFDAADQAEAKEFTQAVIDALEEDFDHLIITGDLEMDGEHLLQLHNLPDNEADLALEKLIEGTGKPANEADKALDKLKKKEDIGTNN